MPSDNPSLRQVLLACIPSLVIDEVAKESGQRVVYFAHFEDNLIPADLPVESKFLRGWQNWGSIVVKVASGIDATSLTYLQREIELLKEFNSPYFPALRFSEVFTENPLTEEPLSERLFVTIEERVESLPLGSVAASYTTEASVANLLLKLCRALNMLWAHNKRLVHRDIKPDNILIRPNGEVVIIDLGIVRETGSPGITKTAYPFGPMTVAYAAPEQTINDKHISFKTDFFALGIIGYQLLSGNHPFAPSPNTSIAQIMVNVQQLDPPSLSTIGVASPEFSALIKQLLEKQPYKRFRTPDQLINALNSITGSS
jgi:serine/threonine protein kinase